MNANYDLTPIDIIIDPNDDYAIKLAKEALAEVKRIEQISIALDKDQTELQVLIISCALRTYEIEVIKRRGETRAILNAFQTANRIRKD